MDFHFHIRGRPVYEILWDFALYLISSKIISECEEEEKDNNRKAVFKIYLLV